MIDIKTPESPGWWLARLHTKLRGRQPELNLLNAWYEGNPPLPEGAKNREDAYKAFQRYAMTNWAELIVEAVRERMVPIGFRTALSADTVGDEVAWKIFTDNSLPVEIADVFTSMLALRDGFVIIGGEGPAGGPFRPIITGEDPRQVVTIHDPVQQSQVRAGAKFFHDPDAERAYAYVFLPADEDVGRERAVRWVASKKAVKPLVGFSAQSWDWDEEFGGADGEELPHGRVPIVRFRNRRGVGEFEKHLGHMARINHQTLQRMTIATMQAFRQRAVKGALPKYDEDGNELDYSELFSAHPGAVWELPEGVELWESGQVDLTGILAANKDDVRDLAAATRTPVNYLMPDAIGQSAEGAAAMREGLVFKAEDRIRRASEALKDVMSIALLVAGDEARADRGQLEVLWAPADRISLAERYDAASKAEAAGVTWRARMEMLGFTPPQIAEMERDRATEAFLTVPAAAPAPARVPAVPVVPEPAPV